MWHLRLLLARSHLRITSKHRYNYRVAWRQSRTLMKVQFPLPQVSAQRDCICETITLSQSKEAAFKWTVGALGGANNHSSLSHCVTEVLNPPFVLHITCLSMACLVLHFRHLDGHAFKGGARGPEGMRAPRSDEEHFQNVPFSLFAGAARHCICYKHLFFPLVLSCAPASCFSFFWRGGKL